MAVFSRQVCFSLFTVACLFVATAVYAAEPAEGDAASAAPVEGPADVVDESTGDTVESSVVSGESAGDVLEEVVVTENWLDKSHRYTSSSGDALARWLDSFFGTPVSDIEAPSSLLRLSAQYEIDEKEEDEFRIKARGKLKLPALSERFSLVFSGDEGDGGDRLARSREEADDGQAALQYTLQEKSRHRFDLFGGVRAGLKARAGVRYRFEFSPTDKQFHRISQELAYDQSDRAIATTRFDLNYQIFDKSLIRWANRGRYGEETDGVEWRTSLGWGQRLSRKRAITFSVGASGITDPKNLTKSYGPGIRYRQMLFRDYLFLDLEPRYSWRKRLEDDQRDGAWSFEIELEMFFEQQKD